MGWTTPTTRISGELITASKWNQDLTDNLIFLKDRGDAGRTIAAGVSETSVFSTTTETDIMSITLPANYLATGSQIVIEIPVQLKNTTGSARTITVRCRYGAGGSVGVAIAMSAPAMTYYSLIRATLLGQGASSQRAVVQILGMPVNVDLFAGGAAAMMTTDSTAAQQLKVTIQNGFSSASLGAVGYGYKVTGPHKNEPT